jgi:hypothetical protein
MGFLLSLAAAAIKVLLSGFGSSFSSSLAGTLGSGVGTLIIDGLKQTGHAEIATQLQTDPQSHICVAAQRHLAEHMNVTPAFRQQTETELQKASPQDWTWAQGAGQAVTDWSAYFSVELERWQTKLKNEAQQKADDLRRKYAISNRQYQYVLTARCPVHGELTLVKYYRPEGQFSQEIKLASWFGGQNDPDPYDDKFVAGSFAQCWNGHDWSVWKADEDARGW